jgi:hypothetical protein
MENENSNTGTVMMGRFNMSAICQFSCFNYGNKNWKTIFRLLLNYMNKEILTVQVIIFAEMFFFSHENY